MDLPTFRVSFPEFTSTPDALVSAKLAEATRTVDVRFPFADDRVGYLTAHLLSLSPFGQQARLDSEKAETTYHTQYLKLCKLAVGGPLRIGQLP